MVMDNGYKNRNNYQQLVFANITDVGEAAEKKKHLYTIGVNQFSHCVEQFGDFQKNRIGLPLDSAIPLLGIYPKEMKSVW